MEQPQNDVVITWMSEQLHDRLQRNGAALSDILRSRPKQLTVIPVDRQLEDLEVEP